jgi:outer membrane lipoprotein-sorting protein
LRLCVLLAPALGAVLASGCAVSQKRAVTPAQIRPAQTASKEQLIAAYDAQARAIRSVNAAVEMMPVAGSTYSGLIEEYHDVGGFILAVPQKIRVIGQAPVLAKNIFDMTSDGKIFRIFIPSKNKFLVGPTDLERPSDKPIENLRPQHILEALFWPAISAGQQVLFEEAEAPPERYYVLTLLRPGQAGPEIARKIWFDRADLRVSRIQIYGPGGRYDSDIAYSDWQPVTAGESTTAGSANPAATSSAELQFPREIRIRRPQQDYALTVSVMRLTLNSEIADDRFTLEQPAGSDLVRLETPAEEHP